MHYDVISISRFDHIQQKIDKNNRFPVISAILSIIQETKTYFYIIKSKPNLI